MRKSSRNSPRLEPGRIYEELCKQAKRQPGGLGLDPKELLSREDRERDLRKRKIVFYALVGQSYVVPKRAEWLRKYQMLIAERTRENDTGRRKRNQKQRVKKHYARRRRKSIYDDLYNLITRLYTNHAAWIVLLGDYLGMKGKCSDSEIERRLKSRYDFLPQMNNPEWFSELIGKGRSGPFHLALRDTAAKFGLGNDDKAAEVLRIMLSTSRLTRARPGYFVWDEMDREERLKILRRIPPRDRTHRDKVLINITQAEFQPSLTEESIAAWRNSKTRI